MARWLRSARRLLLRPYVLSTAFLIAAIASSRGRMPEMAKKQVCMMVLMRRPMPASWATR